MEPPNRVTPLTDFALWTALHTQWLEEGKPSYIVRRGGGQTWMRIQHTSGSDVFDPMNNEAFRDSTGLPKG